MLTLLRKIFKGNSGENFALLVKNGAQVLDVRLPEEFANGHVDGSVNIPLYELNRSLSKLKRDKIFIVCCASGVRSASAKSILESHGFTVYNAGGWKNLKRKMNKTMA